MLLATGDLHVNEIIVAEGLLPRFAQFLEEQRIVYNASILVILGDLWDKHMDPERKVTFGILDAVCDFFHSLHFDTILMLKGNHDESHIGLHNLKILSLDPRIRIVDSPIIFEAGIVKFFCIPFYKDLSHFQRVLEGAPEDVIVLMHQTVKGFMLNAKKIAEEGAIIAKPFPLVISGDLHDFQRGGNIIYIGAPYQTKRDENPQKFILAIADNRISFIEIPTVISQRFLFVDNLDQLETLDLTGKTVIYTGEEIDVQQAEALREKGVKIVVTSLVKKEVDTTTAVDLSGFSLQVLESVVLKAQDPFMRCVGEELLEMMKGQSL